MEQAKNAAQDVHDSDDELEINMDIWRVQSARRDDRERTIADISDLLGTQADQRGHSRREGEKRVTSGVWGVLHGRPR